MPWMVPIEIVTSRSPITPSMSFDLIGLDGFFCWRRIDPIAGRLAEKYYWRKSVKNFQMASIWEWSLPSFLFVKDFLFFLLYTHTPSCMLSSLCHWGFELWLSSILQVGQNKHDSHSNLFEFLLNNNQFSSPMCCWSAARWLCQYCWYNLRTTWFSGGFTSGFYFILMEFVQLHSLFESCIFFGGGGGTQTIEVINGLRWSTYNWAHTPRAISKFILSHNIE